jgi:hypothetical protein
MTSTLEPLTRDDGTTPSTYCKWIPEKEGCLAELEQGFAQWSACLTESATLYVKHVYENPGATQYDFRQHRADLYLNLARGERLAVEFIATGDNDLSKVENYLALIDAKLDELRAVLHAWHGRMKDQDDLPDWVKQGFADVEAGRVVPMEVAMSEVPPSAVRAR